MSETNNKVVDSALTDEVTKEFIENSDKDGTADGEYCSFAEWLLAGNGMQVVSEAMKDLGKAFNKLILLNSRNLGDTDARKEVENFIIGCYQKIDVYYKEYKDTITDADEDDEALNGVREYLESLNSADNEDDL